MWPKGARKEGIMWQVHYRCPRCDSPVGFVGRLEKRHPVTSGIAKPRCEVHECEMGLYSWESTSERLPVKRKPRSRKGGFSAAHLSLF